MTTARAGARWAHPPLEQTFLETPPFLANASRTQHQSAMSTSPTPSERERADAEAKAKEEAEQAALPYKWTQTTKDLDVTIPIDAQYKGRDLDVKIAKTHLKVAIKGQDPIIDVRFSPTPRQQLGELQGLISIPGRPPPPHPRRRVHLDARNCPWRQGD